MTTNYRVVKHYDHHPFHDKNPEEYPEYVEWYGVHEVVYDDQNNIKNWSKMPIDLSGDEIKELKTMTRMIQLALREPVVDAENEKRRK